MLIRLIFLGLAGALAAHAHQPWGQIWAIFIGFWLFNHALLRAQTRRRPWLAGALTGLAFGLGYFGVSVSWIAEAFQVEADRFGALAPFAVGGLALLLAGFWALASGISARYAVKGWPRPFALAGLFTAAEMLRGHAFTGFPWALPGVIWPAGEPISQVASLVGAYGLTLLTFIALFGVGTLGIAKRRGGSLIPAMVGCSLLLIAHQWGVERLKQPVESTPVRLRLVQANIDQKDKWKPEKRLDVLQAYLRLSTQPGDFDVLIWPEAAIPTPLLQDMPALERIRRALKPGQILLSGTYRMDGPVEKPVYYNSVVALQRSDQELRLIGLYDKHHLVPFGEYLPFETLFSALGLKQVVAVSEDGFTPSLDNHSIQAGRAPDVQPLICYEALFPGAGSAGGTARWLVNVSNDAWFGASFGPKQHFNQARYRAIESGLPMARATPTGITALIDPYGRVVGNKTLYFAQTGTVDQSLPAAIARTAYEVYRNKATLVLVLVLLLPFFWRKRA